MNTVTRPVTESGTSRTAPAWALRMRRINDWLLHDALGGPRPLKFSWIINFQKGGTFFFLGFLMWFYCGAHARGHFDGCLDLPGLARQLWPDLAVQGSQLSDPNWQVRITLPSSLYALFGLGLYWSFGWLLISGTAQPHYPLPDAAWYCLCISLCICGSTIMVAADAQKFYTAAGEARTDHGRRVPVHPPSQLPRRDDDLRRLRPAGLALVPGGGAGLFLERPVRGEHGDEGSQHVALPGSGRPTKKAAGGWCRACYKSGPPGRVSKHGRLTLTPAGPAVNAALPVNTRRQTGPALEGATEGALVAVAEAEGNFHQRHCRIAKQHSARVNRTASTSSAKPHPHRSSAVAMCARTSRPSGPPARASRNRNQGC